MLDQLPDPIYVAGPMSNLPGKNVAEFDRVTGILRGLGYRVWNPAALEDSAPEDATYEWFLRNALRMMLYCHTVVLLPGWQRSRGALIEWGLAKDLNMSVFEWEDMAQWAEIVPFRSPAGTQ